MDEDYPLNRFDVYLVAVQLADFSRKIHERMNLSERITKKIFCEFIMELAHRFIVRHASMLLSRTLKGCGNCV